MAGYSSTPLIKKLGIKENFIILPVHAPDDYFNWLGEMRAGVQVMKNVGHKVDFIHLFIQFEKELAQIAQYKPYMKPAGMMWVSWLKKHVKEEGRPNENIIRDTALRNGLVDVKVCAVNDEWSGLKLVYRLKDRI